MPDMQRYDVIIIGTGAGGGTLAHRLADAGKRILLLERGTFLPRERENWDPIEVFQKDRYHTDEIWRDAAGNEIRPGTGYWVGGNTKVYGAALLRLREADFGVMHHPGGTSPAWPLAYRDLEPYYCEAEALYQVRGQRGLDPTEPRMSREYPFPAISHEPRIQEVADKLASIGLHPAYTPLGVRLDEADRMKSACIRCATCDGYPCIVNAKSDSDVTCVRPALQTGSVELITEAKVARLHTSSTGREVSRVVVERRDETLTFAGDIVVVSCGAINSAALLLRSANDRHPNGLANSSGQVGRNFMKHQNGGLLAVSRHLNPTHFQKTLMVNDFYWGDEEFPYPMGHVSLTGKTNEGSLGAGAPAFAPGFALAQMARHSIDWWLTAEDLPDPENRVTLDGDTIKLAYRENNTAAYDTLVRRWQQILKSLDLAEHFVPNELYFRKKIPLAGVGHQCGTVRFGLDPRTSVLDVNCRAHDVDNLYVVDASFFPSSGAVNPSLTIIANALRVGDHLKERLK
jgi:choline dehydrogenase-like flavoprotein